MAEQRGRTPPFSGIAAAHRRPGDKALPGKKTIFPAASKKKESA